jgi:hypothetical protein
MKVQVWTNGPVELEADIEFEDILSALAVMAEEGDDCPNRLTAALDQLTRILAAVEDDWITRLKPQHRAEIRSRLSKQSERY